MNSSWFETHRETLEKAVQAIEQRGYWSSYPEMPSGKIYGETANEDGKRAFESRLNTYLEIDQPGTVGKVGSEVSPFGMKLHITYPKIDADALLPAMLKAKEAWRQASSDDRAGVCMEILSRLNKRSFEIAYAVHHTTGQPFVMAFQAGGPHAQDRGLEAIAYAYEEMKRVPASASWQKPQGKNPPLTMTKTYHIVPRGIGLVIGCCTFPTWNSYPGFFASLVTGNAVLSKPHGGSILPMALTVETARQVLSEAGFDPNIVCLAAEEPGGTLAPDLALRPEVTIIDFTGSSANGRWLEENAHQARVYTEKAGVNSVVIDSAQDFKHAARNIAFSLSLYTGQMCTTPQNIFVPRDGIRVEGGKMSFDDVARSICDGIDKLLGDTARAVEVLGAVQNEGVAQRVERARGAGKILLESNTLEHPQYPDARVMTPLIVQLDAERDSDTYRQEWFGPVSFIIATDSTKQSLSIAADIARERGAITLSVYSTDEKVLEAAEETAIAGGVALSSNLVGGVFVNQSAAFSDYHATGSNPAANSCLTDSDFVAGRFRVIQSRRHAA
jgi:phenylacetic acid degradation protein paaN